jgi:hypothetical protein
LSPDGYHQYYDDEDNNDLEFLDDDDARDDMENKIAMALHSQEYARQMGMDSMRAQALQGARQDFYGQMSSGGQGDADLYDNYSRYNNPPRPKTGYKMQQRPHDNTHYLDDPNDYD